MQTFLPYADFAASARVLDNKRLGKQRVEVLQILNALTGSGGWQNHPAVKMWRGYADALRWYGLEVCVVWRQRGYKDTLMEKFLSEADLQFTKMPPWLGDERLHASHRSNLLRKDLMFYLQYGWKEHAFLPYFWPV